MPPESSDTMTEFYAALLAAEATILGIFLAGVFIYTQIVANRFSHRLARSIVRSRPLYAFVGFSASSLLLTSLALFFVAQTDTDIQLKPIFHSTAYSGASLAVFLATLALFAVILARLSRFLSPAAILDLAEKTFRFDLLSNFVRHRYGSADITLQLTEPHALLRPVRVGVVALRAADLGEAARKAVEAAAEGEGK